MFDFLARYSMREKTIVALALLVVIVIGSDALVIEPYLERVAALNQQIDQQRDDLAWMRVAVARIPAAGVSNDSEAFSGTLANFIDQAVRSQGLSGQLSQMSPVGSDEIRMRYVDVDFNRLVGFIARVSSSGLEVKDLRITPADVAGIVDSNIVLVRR
jgi:type II secretory pathway component PulM